MAASFSMRWTGLLAATIDDDSIKVLWSDNNHWLDGRYGGPKIWPSWRGGAHPLAVSFNGVFGYSFVPNPDAEPEE